MNNYASLLGFTIGPIYEMMSHSRKNRELWFSSYFFSWYVKLFYEKLSKEKGVEILSPYFDPDSPPPNSKAGLFPDHIVAASDKSTDEAFNLLNSKIIDVNNYFIKVIDKLDSGKYLSGRTKADVEKIFKEYLQTSFVVLPAVGIDRKKIVETVDVHLDALERNRYFSLGKNEQTCFRCKSLPSVFKIIDNYDDKQKVQSVCPFCFFKFKSNESDEVCTESNQTRNFRYRSTGEISADELIRYLETNKKEELKEYLKKYDEISFETKTEEGKAFKELLPQKGKEIKDYHKYMAIVIADGDNLGKIANNVEDPQKFSQALFEFGKKATNITKQFHGEPVYLGGDDLLTFMPTAFTENNSIITVLDYVRTLSRNYSDKLNGIEQSGTISFGVHLFYYKSPLSTSLHEARNLLYEAKNEPDKNSVVLQLTQHSGQQIKIKFNLSSTLLTNFSDLLSGLLSGTIKYPEGIHHNLSRFKTVLTNLHDPSQIDAFMKNRFNEDIHKEEHTGIPEVFKMLKEMLTYSSAGSLKIYNGEPADALFDEFLSQIKFIKFITGEK